MSFTEMLHQLPLLSMHEREELRDRIDELDSDGWRKDDGLAEADKQMILGRIDHARQHPESLVAWEVAKTQVQALHGSW